MVRFFLKMTKRSSKAKDIPETPENLNKEADAIEGAAVSQGTKSTTTTTLQNESKSTLEFAVKSFKRKETEDNDLLLLKEKTKIVKMAQEMAVAVDSDNGKQYTFRVHNICQMISSLATKRASTKDISVDTAQDEDF